MQGTHLTRLRIAGRVRLYCNTLTKAGNNARRPVGGPDGAQLASRVRAPGQSQKR